MAKKEKDRPDTEGAHADSDMEQFYEAMQEKLARRSKQKGITMLDMALIYSLAIGPIHKSRSVKEG